MDVRKFPPVSYKTLALWGHCPAVTPLLQLITTSRPLGTADHVQTLGELLAVYLVLFNCERFLHYCSGQTVRNWSALYPALFFLAVFAGDEFFSLKFAVNAEYHVLN